MNEHEPLDATVEVTIDPGEEWTDVRIVGAPPENGEPDTRTLVRVRHTNEGPITLVVHPDGAVSFEGDPVDYPAEGWRVSWLPWLDAVAMTAQPTPTDALGGHGLEPSNQVVPVPLVAPPI